MDAEIKRQWPKSTAPQQETLPPAVSPPAATAPSAGGFNQWLGGVLRHPIIVGLVLLGVPALIGVLSKVLGG